MKRTRCGRGEAEVSEPARARRQRGGSCRPRETDNDPFEMTKIQIEAASNEWRKDSLSELVSQSTLQATMADPPEEFKPILLDDDNEENDENSAIKGNTFEPLQVEDDASSLPRPFFDISL